MLADGGITATTDLQCVHLAYLNGDDSTSLEVMYVWPCRWDGCMFVKVEGWQRWAGIERHISIRSSHSRQQRQADRLSKVVFQAGPGHHYIERSCARSWRNGRFALQESKIRSNGNPHLLVCVTRWPPRTIRRRTDLLLAYNRLIYDDLCAPDRTSLGGTTE